jgi:hypothetical protein
MAFYRLDELPATEMLPGVHRRAVHVDDLMITLSILGPVRSFPSTITLTSRSRGSSLER